jgi:hypothetical protein
MTERATSGSGFCDPRFSGPGKNRRLFSSLLHGSCPRRAGGRAEEPDLVARKRDDNFIRGIARRSRKSVINVQLFFMLLSLIYVE